jgi:predicted nucleotidyltransferase
MIREGIALPPGILARIAPLARILSADPEIAALYLFGSAAEGKLAPLSDIDLAFLLSPSLDKRQRFNKHLDLIGLVTDSLGTEECDIVVLNDAPSRFGHTILRGGRLLFCNNRSALVDFCDRTVMRHLDFQPLREDFNRVFLKGIGYRGP